jgi:hypothetical protein
VLVHAHVNESLSIPWFLQIHGSASSELLHDSNRTAKRTLPACFL